MSDDGRERQVGDIEVEAINILRWKLLTRTSPSGKSLFSCYCCGRVSPTPDKRCPPVFDGEDWECEQWPNHPKHALTLEDLKATVKPLCSQQEYIKRLERERDDFLSRLRGITHDLDELVGDLEGGYQ